MVTILCVGIVAGAAYAYAAANTVNASRAGNGAGSINGYTLSGLSYTLNTNDPRNVDSVAFTLNPGNAQTVKTQLAAAGSWYSCTNASGSVTCTTTGATAQGSAQLTVVSVQ